MLVREWYDAEDERGMDSTKRLEKRLEIRQWLLNFFNAPSFPLQTQFIKGIPIVNFEGLITSYERKIQLYNFIKSCVNDRSGKFLFCPW